MITLMEGFPDNVVAVRAEGQVTAQDDDNVLIPAVEKAPTRNKKLRFYCEIGPGFDGMDLGAMRKDLRVGFGHLGQLHFAAWRAGHSARHDSGLRPCRRACEVAGSIRRSVPALRAAFAALPRHQAESRPALRGRIRPENAARAVGAQRRHEGVCDSIFGAGHVRTGHCRPTHAASVFRLNVLGERAGFSRYRRKTWRADWRSFSSRHRSWRVSPGRRTLVLASPARRSGCYAAARPAGRG